MQLLSTLVWLLGLQMNQLIFPPSFFQQTFIMWLFWLKHCVHCWIYSKKGNRKKEITRSSFYAHCLARKSPLQGVLVQCSLVTEKLSPSYVIKLLWPSIPQTPLLLHHDEARRGEHTTMVTWLSQTLFPEECKGKMLTKCLWNDLGFPSDSA